jgi:uncharacterized protein YyaL (SSP411 family)
MLYDNAQLARVYLHAWQVTGNGFFRTITEEILDYVVREMTYVGSGANDQQLRPEPKLPSNATDKVGGVAFYSIQDADSEGEEGKFFVWTPDEIREVLGSDADEFMAAYGASRHGNASTGSANGFEGKNILEFVGHMDERPALAGARCVLQTCHALSAQMAEPGPRLSEIPGTLTQGRRQYRGLTDILQPLVGRGVSPPCTNG